MWPSYLIAKCLIFLIMSLVIIILTRFLFSTNPKRLIPVKPILFFSGLYRSMKRVKEVKKKNSNPSPPSRTHPLTSPKQSSISPGSGTCKTPANYIHSDSRSRIQRLVFQELLTYLLKNQKMSIVVMEKLNSHLGKLLMLNSQGTPYTKRHFRWTRD